MSLPPQPQPQPQPPPHAAPNAIPTPNEIAVAGFLDRKIGFLTMSGIIEECMQKINFIAKPTLTDYLNTDKETRIFAENYIQQLPSKTLQF